ncbi:MAG: ABC transporter permease subunit [Chloroflexota bacterium]|jgi:phosphonate transport system permease protein
MDEEKKGRRSRIITIAIVVLAIVLFAYAVDVTNVDFTEPLEPQRQQNLFSLLRALARPNIFAYENETRSTNVSLLMPCPEEFRGTQVTLEGRQVTMIPNCVSTTQDELQMVGQGFNPNAQIVLRWQPNESPSTRTLATFKADAQGGFETVFSMPDVRESDQPQNIEVVEGISRSITGLSDTTQTTLSRIVETILMALMASTLGTIIAIPVSFMGARNLMADVGMPLASVMAAIIAIPIGFAIGYFITDGLVNLSQLADENAWISLIAFLVAAGLIFVILRFGPPLFGEEDPQLGTRLLTAVRLLLVMILSVLAVTWLAQLGMVAGTWIMDTLASIPILSTLIFVPVGNFIFVISDVFIVFVPIVVGFILGIILASYANRLGQEAIFHLEEGPARLLTVILSAIGASLLIFGVLYLLWWINLLGFRDALPEENAVATLGTVSLIAGTVLGLLSALAKPKRQYPIGMVTYTITRTTLNTMRAIEPLILGFVFVVWVGIGPFAGVMALMLHSIADLGKLFSEQVENIDEGPVEAVTATGASRVQTINFAVIPQIVPHYIAFIFYRWDINVRMSTIIGFVGGGGIGLILNLSINQLRYADAAVMIIAIALVVMILDFVSSYVRRRII